MAVGKAVLEAFGFICSAAFWRAGVLWTLSLIFSHLKLITQTRKRYSRCSPKDSNFAADAVQRPVCIVTGATSGLGAAAAHALSKEGFYVVLVSRSSEKLMKVISDIKRQNHEACLKAFEVNLSSFKSILEFKQLFQQWQRDSGMHSSIQLLINNAGILATSQRFTSEGYDEMMATNYIGPFCLTKTLLPLLENSPTPARVVNVSSFTHWSVCCKRADLEAVTGRCFLKSKGYPYAHIYEYSKFCMLLFAYELHKQISLLEKSQHISVVAADPGMVKTNIMRQVPPCLAEMSYIALTPLGVVRSSEEGVSSVLDAALAPPEVSGVYFFGGNGRTLNSSPLSYNANLAKELWTTSCNLFEELQMAS
ncbi:uncharacterized protein LOC127254518 [Andrographis paniculata]|uniref:uncharacterized protein LOC127254518 n=1 Tax=Andrographis paniculata TaxID=175694 RepID=UPI0021E73F56|nr:uncharacterized protein LOC127254518 [Andrographis paniculata]